MRDLDPIFLEKRITALEKGKSPTPTPTTENHIYSTDEKEVGTWIDGSKVYEKTLDITTNASTGNYDVTDLNIKEVISFNGFHKSATQCLPVTYIYATSDFTSVYFDSNKLYYRIVGAEVSKLYVTIRYTKN